jgi:UDP-hydrolysing UDP-N-acetyl-D-glucosamine 2-epimerase
MVKTASLMAIECSSLFAKIKPDIVLIHGDRYEQLGVAMAASYLNIPIAHTEGGEVSGCIDDKVRNAITALADIHLAVTQKAVWRLQNIANGKVYLVGSPAIDLCKEAIGSDLNAEVNEPYILVLHHPNTTEKEAIRPLIHALDGIQLKKIWINSNVDAGSREMAKLFHKTDWEFKKNLTPEEYYRLLNGCEVAVGNSSSFLKEGAWLGIPSVIVGFRQQYREHQENVIFVTDKDEKDIAEKICDQLDYGRYEPNYTYGDGNASKKIVDILREVSL